MITFFACLVLLLVGFFTYGKLVEKVGLWQVLLMDPGRTITQLWRTNRGHGL